MDLSLDWTPTKGPNGLAPFEAFRLVENDDETPSRGSGWLKTDVRELVAHSPASEDLIWKSVLAIWRLKSMEGRLKEEEKELAEPWAEHMSAWLTRHEDLCHAFHLEPLQIITECAKDCVAAGHIPNRMVAHSRDPEIIPFPCATKSDENGWSPRSSWHERKVEKTNEEQTPFPPQVDEGNSTGLALNRPGSSKRKKGLRKGQSTKRLEGTYADSKLQIFAGAERMEEEKGELGRMGESLLTRVGKVKGPLPTRWEREEESLASGTPLASTSSAPNVGSVSTMASATLFYSDLARFGAGPSPREMSLPDLEL
ncbi:hypothetical protein BJ322DRAFT_1025069 [Thelephora terrestris]|nr:hypothetical protein BJ322DRAFT_1025069 [Thelephora terrestris]